MFFDGKLANLLEEPDTGAKTAESPLRRGSGSNRRTPITTDLGSVCFTALLLGFTLWSERLTNPSCESRWAYRALSAGYRTDSVSVL